MSSPAPTLLSTYACAPATVRGRGVLLGVHAGRDVVAYANGKAIVVRSLTDPSDVRVYDGHQYPTTVARLSPNGEWVASGDVAGHVRVWGLNEDMTLKAEHHPLSGAVDDIAWSDDGQRIVACGDGRGSVFAKAFMWDTGNAVGDISGATKRVNSVDFKPGRPYRVVAGSEDFTVSLYAGPPFKFDATAHKHANFVNCVRYAPDGSRFASVGSDGVGKIYDGKTGATLADIPPGKLGKGPGHTGTIYACSWSPDGARVLTAGADKTCRLWSAPADLAAGATCELLGVYPCGGSNPGVGDMQVGCAFAGERAFALSLDGDLRELDLGAVDDERARASGAKRPISVIRGHPKPVAWLAATPERVYAAGLGALGDGAGQTLRWSASGEATRVATTPGPGPGLQKKSPATVAGVARAGRLFAAGLDDALHVASTDGGGDEDGDAFDADGVALPAQPRDVDASADAAVVAVATAAGATILRRADDEDASSSSSSSYAVVGNVAPEGGARASAVGVASDGNAVAIGCENGEVRVLRAGEVTGDVTDAGATVLRRHRGEVTAARFHPSDPSTLATCDANREVLVWNVDTGAVVMDKMVFHKARVTSLAWCPDGRRIATGGLDGAVIVWDLDRPAMARAEAEGAHPGGVTAVDWMDEKTLCSAGFDACVRTWRA